MATTTTVYSVNSLKGPHQGGDLHCYEVVVLVDGTYATAGKPNFNVLTALQNQHEGVSAVSVTKVVAFQDYNDGTNVYTASNAGISLSGTGNQTVTFTVESGATDGATGSEISDSTALHGFFSFIVVTSVTGA